MISGCKFVHLGACAGALALAMSVSLDAMASPPSVPTMEYPLGTHEGVAIKFKFKAASTAAWYQIWINNGADAKVFDEWNRSNDTA